MKLPCKTGTKEITEIDSTEEKESGLGVGG